MPTVADGLDATLRRWWKGPIGNQSVPSLVNVHALTLQVRVQNEFVGLIEIPKNGSPKNNTRNTDFHSRARAVMTRIPIPGHTVFAAGGAPAEDGDAGQGQLPLFRGGGRGRSQA